MIQSNNREKYMRRKNQGFKRKCGNENKIHEHEVQTNEVSVISEWVIREIQIIWEVRQSPIIFVIMCADGLFYIYRIYSCLGMCGYIIMWKYAKDCVTYSERRLIFKNSQVSDSHGHAISSSLSPYTLLIFY